MRKFYEPIIIEVTNPRGYAEQFPSKYATCKHFGIFMAALQSFVTKDAVRRGRYKGWKFREIN